MQSTLDAQYWNNRHQTGNTPWNLNMPSPPLIAYIDQLKEKNMAVLIPGAGHAHEAKYLADHNFKDITICDISQAAIDKLKNDLIAYPEIKYICSDFFDLTGQYDLILEQTFFCALDPKMRTAYVDKMKELLKPEGTLAGVLFASEFQQPGPPFGGNINEYKSLFSQKLHMHRIEICYNSATPRKDNELFFICKKIPS